MQEENERVFLALLVVEWLDQAILQGHTVAADELTRFVDSARVLVLGRGSLRRLRVLGHQWNAGGRKKESEQASKRRNASCLAS
jgi:hypothetical protein